MMTPSENRRDLYMEGHMDGQAIGASEEEARWRDCIERIVEYIDERIAINAEDMEVDVCMGLRSAKMIIEEALEEM